MIKQLHIKNFQSHKDSILNFNPGLNVIIGNSDSGKTALIRSLNKLINNRPLGNEFQSYWGGDTSIEIDTDEDQISLTILEKGKDKCYKLNDIEFKAFGTDVPEEIKQALNISEINLQNQFDHPFLLDSTPGEVASHFNRIAHIDKIDSALKKMNSWILNIQSILGHDEEKNKQATGLIRELNSLKKQLANFPDLEKRETELEVLEGMEENYQNKINSLSKLKYLIQNIKNSEKEINKYSRILKQEKHINSLLDKYKSIENKEEQITSLSLTIRRILKVESQLLSNNQILHREKEVNTLLNLINKQNTLNKEITAIKIPISLLKDTFILSKKKMAEIEAKQVIFKREMPDVCPLCGK